MPTTASQGNLTETLFFCSYLLWPLYHLVFSITHYATRAGTALNQFNYIDLTKMNCWSSPMVQKS